MYSIFSCWSAAATSASRTFVNSLGPVAAGLSSSPARRRTSTNSFVASGFCALNKSASITRARFICILCSDHALNCLSDAIGLFVDLVEFAALDQKTNLRFGTGIAQQHAAFAGKLALDFLPQLHHFAQFFNRRLGPYQQVALGLRVFFQTRL